MTDLRGKALHYLQARECKRSPDVLPLRHQGRYQMFSKACVRLGLMNGCEVILEDTNFHPNEPLAFYYNAGAMHICTYLPESLLVRVPGVEWFLHETTFLIFLQTLRGEASSCCVPERLFHNGSSRQHEEED